MDLLKTIFNYYKIAPAVEITLECNPDDLSGTKLSEWKDIGINRLSIGVQSFCNTDLKFMNRKHSAEEAIQSIKLAQKFEFQNISIDLIYGLPKQTLKKWKNPPPISIPAFINNTRIETSLVQHPKRHYSYHETSLDQCLDALKASTSLNRNDRKELLKSFKSKEGSVISLTKGSARNGFDRARKKAGLENLRFHDLRHIAISRMWSSGMNALEISACSGHRDIKMLMRYSHYQLSF